MSTFSELKKSYNNFIAPAFKIETDGTELPVAMGAGKLSVDLGMGTTSGACRFTVSNLFKAGTRQVNADYLDSLGIGKKIKVFIGYGSSLTAVFSGYIASLGLRWSDNMSISVTCLDARSLMKENRSDIAFEGKTITAVVEEILDSYSALISSHEVLMTDLVCNANITKLTNDLSFICDEAAKQGIDFILDFDKVTLKSDAPETCLTLDWEEYELSFDIGYLKTEYKLKGYDIENMESHEKTGKAEQPGTQTELMTVKKELPVEVSVSPEAVEAILSGKIKEDVRSSIKGSISCAGLPEIKPGKLIKLTNTPLGKLGLGSEFTVLTARHSLDDSGFRTSVTIGGVGN